MLNSIAFGIAVFEGAVTIESRRQLRLEHLMELFIDQDRAISTKLRTMPWSKELHFFIKAKETRSHHCLKTHLYQSRTTHLITTVSITIDCLSSNSAWSPILYIVYSLTVPGQTTTPTKATTSIMGGCKTLTPHIWGEYSDSEETVDTQVP
jgi:hypothetical protein